MRLAICDDIFEDADFTKNVIDKYFENKNEDKVINYFTPIDLSNELDKNIFDYDIAVLDIDFGNDDYNGIDLGRIINKVNPLCSIIYLTGILDYASDVYETEHCYFVMKKNQHITLERALDKAISLINEEKDKKAVKIVSSGKELIISTGEIRYITRESRKIKLFLDKSYESYMSLNDCLSLLPRKFVRCHTGYIVNMDFIKIIDGNKIFLSDDTQIPVGRIYKEKFMIRYVEYLEGRV